MKVSAVQVNAQPDKAGNLARMQAQIERLMAEDRPDFIVFPEFSPFVSSSAELLQREAESGGSGEACDLIAQLAAQHRVNIHLGSLVEREGDRFYNTSIVFDRTGAIIARYRKMHRFDVTLPDGTEILESQMVDAGDCVTCVDIEGVRFGMSICYDLRFGELYRALEKQGAQVLLIPAAFMQQTGIDHWEVLIRARAIETLCYVVAPCQIGSYDNGTRTNFGHTMIVDPWGLVIAQASNRETAITARIDPDYIEQLRAKLPVARHRVLA